jgi:asparagine synthase (glutamine-hydrolysing)
MEKYWLRTSFAKYFDQTGRPILPESVLWRKKEAFSDGVSANERSLYQILQEYASSIVKLPLNMSSYTDLYNNSRFGSITHNAPTTAEQYYYRKLFESYYQGMSKVVPYFWMPKYVDATDASARTLAHYSETTI